MGNNMLALKNPPSLLNWKVVTWRRRSAVGAVTSRGKTITAV